MPIEYRLSVEDIRGIDGLGLCAMRMLSERSQVRDHRCKKENRWVVNKRIAVRVYVCVCVCVRVCMCVFIYIYMCVCLRGRERDIETHLPLVRVAEAIIWNNSSPLSTCFASSASCCTYLSRIDAPLCTLSYKKSIRLGDLVRCIILSYVMLCYVMLCYVILSYVM